MLFHFTVMTEFTDIEIVECLRKRQSHVVKYLSDKYLPMIRLMVTQNHGNHEDAKDIFQDGLIIILERIDTNQLVLTCKFKSFLFSICEKLWLRVLEKRRAAANYFIRKEDSSTEQDFTEVYDNQVYEKIFYEIFDTLDPISKEILNLYWQEHSLIEIAKKFGYTYGYIRKKKSECQAELLKRISNNPDYIKIKHSNVSKFQMVSNLE